MISLDDSDLGDAEITVDIFNKPNMTVIQTIKIKSEFILKSSSFKNCSKNRSFFKRKNPEIKVYDNDFGDIIIADFNFDGKEDLAIKREEGGNGGAIYNFYIQANHAFVYNHFLSNEVSFFPYYFDRKKKQLRIFCRVNSTEHEVTTIEYSGTTQSWKIISKHRYDN